MKMTNNIWMRKRILELAKNAGSNGAHLGGSLSLVEVLNVLYCQDLNLNPKDKNRDRIIMSKGHGALALYCMLEMKGIITKEDANTFEHNGSSLFAHAKRNIEKGIEFSGGSLSLGFSFAVGVALSCKCFGNHIYVILGDGECNEGLVWEAAMAAAHYRLENMTIIVDHNGLQSDGYTKDVMDSASLAEKFRAFGFNAYEVDGHCEKELNAVLKIKSEGKPKAIIANTIKGKGVSFLENQPTSHHSILKEEQYEQAIKEVENGEI